MSPEPERPPIADAGPSADTRAIAAAITAVERREAEARGHRARSLWVQVSRVGTLGWLIALPIVGGALLGHLVDDRLGTGLTFTLALLGVGLVVAGYALWRHTREQTA